MGKRETGGVGENSTKQQSRKNYYITAILLRRSRSGAGVMRLMHCSSEKTANTNSNSAEGVENGKCLIGG